MMDSFACEQLTPLLDASGPVWRWRADNPVAAALDPVSAEQFHRAAEITRPAGVRPADADRARPGFGNGVTSADFSAGGVVYKFDPTTAQSAPKQLIWSSSVSGCRRRMSRSFPKTTPLQQISFTGPWALFQADGSAASKQNAGPTSFTATFGQGAATASFKLTLPTDQNPFSRGGLWSFRCPSTL